MLFKDDDSREIYYLGISIKNVGSEVRRLGEWISDSHDLIGNGMSITPHEILRNLREQALKLDYLIEKAEELWKG